MPFSFQLARRSALFLCLLFFLAACQNSSSGRSGSSLGSDQSENAGGGSGGGDTVGNPGETPRPSQCSGSASNSSTFESVKIANGLNVSIWYPSSIVQAAAACGGVPLIVFSHGLGACGNNYTMMTAELARQGFIVVAPDHADGSCGGGGLGSITPILTPPDSWNETMYADRRADVQNTLDWATTASWFAGYVDTDRIGAMGHSLGGYTAIGMAGAWPSWRDVRIRAVLALAPYVAPYLADREVANVQIPLMYQGATGDLLITPFLTGASGAYELTRSQKYLVMLSGGSHSMWASASGTEARLILDYGVGFFRKHLLGENPARLNSADPALSSYAHAP